MNKLKFKTAKCERSGKQIFLSDWLLVCNSSTGEWSFLSIDANKNTFDCYIELTALVKSSEAHTTSITWKQEMILTGSNSRKGSLSGLKKWKILDAERWKVLGTV